MTKKRKQKSFFSFPFLVFLIVACLFLSAMNIKIWRERNTNIEQLSQIEKELHGLQEQREILKAQIIDDSDDALIERIAREQLLLQKEGENVVIISRSNEAPKDKEKEDDSDGGFIEQFLDIFRQ